MPLSSQGYGSLGLTFLAIADISPLVLNPALPLTMADLSPSILNSVYVWLRLISLLLYQTLHYV